MSAPAAKALSLPVRTIAAIAGSPSRLSKARPSSAISARFSAFSACGRFSRTRPTAPRRSTRMLSYCVSLIAALLGVVAGRVEHALAGQDAGAGDVAQLNADAVRVLE